MTELRERVKTLEDDLTASRRQGDAATIADEIVGQARTLVGELLNGEHGRMKAILDELVEKVELRFEPAAWGRRTVRRVAACDLYLRDSLTTDGRGDRTPIELFMRDALGLDGGVQRLILAA